MRRRGNPGIQIGILLLMKEMFRINISRIPVTTLFFILFQAGLYMNLLNVPWNQQDVCISSAGIITDKNFKSLLLASLEHGNDMHLYYNMASFLIKGRVLEPRYGSLNFAALILWIIFTSNITYVILNVIYYNLFDDRSSLLTCAIGFSGVIFGLNVILNGEKLLRAYPVLPFLTIPPKYAVFVELVLIRLLAPNSSFFGHAAGIIAGLLYSATPMGRLFDYLISTCTGDCFNHTNSRTRRRNLE